MSRRGSNHAAADCRRYVRRDDRHRCPARFQTGNVERHGPQRTSGRVDEMTARHVVCVTATAHENLSRPGPQIEDGYLRGIEATGIVADKRPLLLVAPSTRL